MGEGLVSMDAGESVAYPFHHGAQVVSTPIGEFSSADVRPDTFDGIDVRRVSRQSSYRQTAFVLLQVFGHQTATVRGQSVPDQHQLLAPELAAELSEEVDELHLVEAIAHDAEVHSALPPIPSVGQHRTNGELLPIERMGEQGCLSTRRPCPSYRRALRNATFIKENYPCAPGSSFFFTSSHV